MLHFRKIISIFSISVYLSEIGMDQNYWKVNQHNFCCLDEDTTFFTVARFFFQTIVSDLPETNFLIVLHWGRLQNVWSNATECIIELVDKNFAILLRLTSRTNDGLAVSFITKFTVPFLLYVAEVLLIIL